MTSIEKRCGQRTISQDSRLLPWTIFLCILAMGCSTLDREKRSRIIYDSAKHRQSYQLQSDQAVKSNRASNHEQPTRSKRLKDGFGALSQQSRGMALAAGKGLIKGIGWIGMGLTKAIIEDILFDTDRDKNGFDPNPLWHQGYGFNNPNHERIKQGLPVLNFDGSVAK